MKSEAISLLCASSLGGVHYHLGSADVCFPDLRFSTSHPLTLPDSLNFFKHTNPSGGCSSAFSASETEAMKAYIGSPLAAKIVWVSSLLAPAHSLSARKTKYIFPALTTTSAQPFYPFFAFEEEGDAKILKNKTKRVRQEDDPCLDPFLAFPQYQCFDNSIVYRSLTYIYFSFGLSGCPSLEFKPECNLRGYVIHSPPPKWAWSWSRFLCVQSSCHCYLVGGQVLKFCKYRGNFDCHIKLNWRQSSWFESANVTWFLQPIESLYFIMVTAPYSTDPKSNWTKTIFWSQRNQRTRASLG